MNKTSPISVNNESLSLIHCEEYRIAAKDDAFGPKIWDCYLIECCTEGYVTIDINGKEFFIKQGDCYVFAPGDKITYKNTKESRRVELTCFARGSELERALEISGITSTSPFVPQGAYPEICAAIRRILELDGQNSVKSNYLRTSELYKIISALIDDKQKIESASIIQRARDIIDTDYSEPLSVADIARRVGLERCYFSVLFREHTGLSPYAYLSSVRIKKACMLISSTDLPIAEIAVQVGIDPGGFARMFKREVGTTPGKYRKR